MDKGDIARGYGSIEPVERLPELASIGVHDRDIGWLQAATRFFHAGKRGIRFHLSTERVIGESETNIAIGSALFCFHFFERLPWLPAQQQDLPKIPVAVGERRANLKTLPKRALG